MVRFFDLHTLVSTNSRSTSVIFIEILAPERGVGWPSLPLPHLEPQWRFWHTHRRRGDMLINDEHGPMLARWDIGWRWNLDS
jgi:hypothetical protein